MEQNGKDISKTISGESGTNAQGVTGASSGGCLSDNAGLRERYDQMHTRGPSAWFDDGALERDMILRMGEPWNGSLVTEIGCGEGDLCAMIADSGAYHVAGVDYSQEAISKAAEKHPGITFKCCNYRNYKDFCTVLVLQGVLEHLDSPFDELSWMIDNFKPKTIITSSPGFLNPRGIVWMTLSAIEAVMSKTDLHFLHPWQFERFCKDRGYKLIIDSCDIAWGFGDKMIDDLRQRIPLALRDGKIDYDNNKLQSFLDWLDTTKYFIRPKGSFNGAVIGYRIDL